MHFRPISWRLSTVRILKGQCRFFWQMSRVLLNHGNVPSFHKNATQMYARNLNAVPASPQGKCNLGTSVRFPVKIASRDITSIMVVHSWKRVNLLPTKSFWRNKNAFSRAVCPSKNAEGLQVCVPQMIVQPHSRFYVHHRVLSTAGANIDQPNTLGGGGFGCIPPHNTRTGTNLFLFLAQL